MTPDEHRQAGELFDRLRDLPEPERAAALERHPELQARVRALLAADQLAETGAFLGHPAIEDAAQLIQPVLELPRPGTMLGNYRLGDRLGAGGMGVVYAGVDVRLERRAAIKILPYSEAGDGPERVKRFEREARAASQLNHPNIVSIFDAGSSAGHHFIATEFIEGQTLRELLQASPQGLDAQAVLDITAQTASALGAAHESGIIHRDIKPENIMVRPDGFVKVLDFGLAKLLDTPDSVQAGSTLRTRPGHLAGTIQYLSPEQVAGKPVDARSDLFSLGVVAYELATGARPFDGSTDGAIYSSILHGVPPPPSELRPALGGQLDGLILRALEKDPELRFQTASDLRSSCKRLTRDASQPHLVLPPAPRTYPPWQRMAAIAALVFASVATGYLLFRATPAGHPTPDRFARLTDLPGEENFPGFSPDSKQFIYASGARGNWDIYLQRTGGSTSINLTRDSDADDTQPALSFDGSRIVFRSAREGGGLFVMEATGENVRRVSVDGYRPAWSPDNRHVVYSSKTFSSPSIRGSLTSRLTIVDLVDGTARELKTDDAIQPNWSPHGDRIAFWGVSDGGRRDLFTVAASGSEPPVRVTADEAIDWAPVWSARGTHLYFLSNRGGTMNVWRVAIDEPSGRLLGEPEPVTVPAQYVSSLALGGDGRSLLYSQGSQRSTLNRIAFDAAQRTVHGPPEAVGTDHTVSSFSFSPDGHQLVADTMGDSSEDLWIMNADGSGRRRLISDSHRNRAGQWSPDGSEILFLSDRSGQYGSWVVRTDGSLLRPLTTPRTSSMQKGIWLPDGDVLAGRSVGTSVLLHPRASQPAEHPDPPPGLADAGYFIFNDAIETPRGIWATADRIGSPAGTEVALYSRRDGKLERPGLMGRSAHWLRGPEPGRYFIFARGSEALLYDRKLGKETTLFSTAPNAIYCLAVSPDSRQIYFTLTIHDADLWWARLQP